MLKSQVQLLGNGVVADVTKTRSLEWALIQYDLRSYKKGKFQYRDTHGEKTMWGDTERATYKPLRGAWSRSFPHSPRTNQPANTLILDFQRLDLVGVLAGWIP